MVRSAPFLREAGGETTTAAKTKAPAQAQWTLRLPIEVIDRPRGVWWARVGPLTKDGMGGRLCQDQTHPVYVGVRPPGNGAGQHGNEWSRRFYLCEVCFPHKGVRP